MSTVSSPTSTPNGRAVAIAIAASPPSARPIPPPAVRRQRLVEQRAEVQRLRAFVDAKKRLVEAAEKRYDIQAAVVELIALAEPLFTSNSIKSLFLEHFYRDVSAFLLGFVAIHLEVCFSDLQRKQALDVFFDREFIPAGRAAGALAATLSATKTGRSGSDEVAAQDAEASVSQCVRLLEKVISDGGMEVVVEEMIEQEQANADGRDERNVIRLQVLVSQLSSLPDIVYNRCERETPALFRPRRYFRTLCNALFRVCSRQITGVKPSRVFGMFADKLTRIGQAQALVQAWVGAMDKEISRETSHSLFQSLPESCHEQILLQIASEKAPSSLIPEQAFCLPKYRLLAAVPPPVAANKHFQFVIAHKLLLRKPIDDLLFWRALANVLVCGGGDPCQSPLASVFDVVLARWSQNNFAITTDYAVNASVCFFLRYSLRMLAMKDHGENFAQRDWTTKLCKGVQDHMGHSLERVRILGMRVAESLSHVIAADQPLDFGLEGEDPLVVYGSPVSAETLEKRLDDLSISDSHHREDEKQRQSSSGIDKEHANRRKQRKAPKPFTLDPDELVLSDDDEVGEDGESGSSFSDDDDDSDSDMSLEAYDLHDDEEDLTAKRPLYLKDLIAGLLSDDDREKTEAALTEAERFLRRRPRDLNDKAQDVVRALLRLEDKYSTPQFVRLRSEALASACALAPTHTVPYLCSQALEREQLLQSRIDVLQAMTSAAQELSERGGYQQPRGPKTLLQEKVGSQRTSLATGDLKERTMQSLKTRRWGYRRDPLVAPKKNDFAPYALEFFSPLLFGYVEYVQKHSVGSGKPRSDVEQTFLAHLLHALASFVECAGHAPQTVAMAKCLLEFAWSEHTNTNAEVRRQVLFSVSRVLLVVPPALLRQEVGDALVQVAPWLHQVQSLDPDAGCREAARLLASFAQMPSLPLSLG